MPRPRNVSATGALTRISRVVLAGASPIRVSAGAPGSRLQPGGEIRPRRAECQKPLKERGANRRAATISERTIRKKRSIQRNPRWYFVQPWPSPKATKKLRERVRELTGKRQSGKGVKQIIAELTPVLRGWGNYFRTGNADREFNKMDGFVMKRLRRWQHRRGGQRPAKRAPYTGAQLRGMGLRQLMGAVKYPSQATPRRSSLSRVPENGMHGFERGN